MATAGQPPTSAYRACMKEAAAQAGPLMQRVVARARAAMPRRAAQTADVVERNLLAEAARVLQHHEVVLCNTYPQALLQEFAQAISGDARRAAGVSFDSLELMGEDQVQESVEVVRAHQLVQAAVEIELTELNALVCAALGLKTVQPERNPLRPDVYVRALRTAIQQSPVSASVRRRWVLNLGEALAPELAAGYKQLSNFLRAHGVTEPGFAAAAAPAEAAPHDDKTLLNVRELKRLLSGEFGAARSGAADFGATVPAAYEALQEMRQVEQVMQRLREGRATLDAEARTPAQKLGLLVVNLMVENIAGDKRLLPAVQQAVRDLEPALLRLALVDPRFFSDKQHPARRLLEQVTQRSLAWAAEDAPGFREFCAPLQEAVQALRDPRAAGAEPFDFALKSLEDAWHDTQPRARGREKAVRVLLRAEQRNLLAEKLALQLRALPEVMHAPMFVQQFVAGPWAQVVAQTRLADDTGSPDPHGCMALVPELVLAATHRARITPRLIERLRDGLARIDYPQDATQKFFGLLASATREGEALEPADTDRDAWLAPAEAQQSNFVTLENLPPRARFHRTEPGFIETEPGGVDAAMPEVGIAPGTWVDLFAGGSWGRWQLTWASPHGTLFLFTHASGKTQSMTRRLVHKLMIAGALKLVSTQAVVDKALDLVADRAIRNSL